MPCPSCGTMISKDAVMCYACGTKIEGAAEEAPAEKEAPAEGAEDEMPCPSCGTMISNDAVMCYACGTKIEGAEEGEDISVKKVSKKRVV